MAAPTVISTASLDFGSTTYFVKSLPAGKPQTADPVEVTTCADTRKKFVPGALVTNDDISVKIAGDSPPVENTKATLSFTLGGTTVPVGDAVVKSVKASSIEASGSGRELTWDVVFAPCGAAPASS